MQRRSIAVIALLCTSCAAPRPSADSDAALEATARRAHQNYVDAINSNNLDSLMGMLTNDVVFLSAGAPAMVGKDAVRPWLAGYYTAYRTHWDKPVQVFVISGEWAFERYSYVSTDTARAGGAVVRSTGWGLLVYHRDPDGKWRVARDAFGPDHAPVAH
jgi:ketosteroid isomerase-like protein